MQRFFNRVGRAVVVSAILSSAAAPVFAQSTDALPTPTATVAPTVVRLDEATIARGYTIQEPTTKLRVIAPAGALSQPAAISIAPLSDPLPPLSDDFTASRWWQIDIDLDDAFAPKGALIAMLPIDATQSSLPMVISWDQTQQRWSVLPTQINWKTREARVSLTTPDARLAVAYHHAAMASGKASWYRYKSCLCAASPDYPKGAKLKVTRVDTGKTVIVTVNDFGPVRSLHPERVIDLDILAFRQLGSTGAGILNVAVEPVIPQITGALPGPIASSDPKLDAKAALVMDATTGEVLWSSNADSVRSIASLTKLASTSVFLNQGIPLGVTVGYSPVDTHEGAYLRWEKNEVFTASDLLYATLIGSANNTADALMRASGLGEEQFVAQMNAIADELNLAHTEFTDPTGLDVTNVSTARELAQLFRAFVTRGQLMAVLSSPQHTVQALGTNRTRTLTNTNELIRTTPKDYQVLGGKTGYLIEAGYCLMTLAQDGSGRKVISVVLGSPSRAASVTSADTLNRWGLAKLAAESQTQTL